jgi:hypothetical protein
MDVQGFFSRREMLCRAGTGLGVLGLAALCAEEQSAKAAVDPLAPRKPHFKAKARQVVHLFMNGGPSQVDTFDPKPMLERYHGKPLKGPNLRTERKTAGALRSPYPFKKYGKCGLEVSDLFARTAIDHADDLCVIRSMHADVPNHEPSLMLMNCGDGRLPRPSFGSWVTYGLGSENRNLPGFLALCPGGQPITGPQNWRAAFLPGAFQGTYLDTAHADIAKLIENIRPQAADAQQRQVLDLVRKLNEKHKAARGEDANLEARIESFELAYRMQREAEEAFDISREPAKLRESYGKGIHGRQLLITRRLLERGVRFIQVWSGAGQPWDNHDGIAAAHKSLAAGWDGPLAAFLTDLKLRGLFDSTLILWGGEFGRTPVAELPQLSGRDHNHYGFSVWLAGAGVKGGIAHGATDEFGFAAVDKRVHVHDLHATMLHLLGIDHEKLTYRYAGRDFRLTDVHGQIVKEILA